MPSSSKKETAEESKTVNLQNLSASKKMDYSSKSKIFSDLLDDVTYVPNPSDNKPVIRFQNDDHHENLRRALTKDFGKSNSGSKVDSFDIVDAFSQAYAPS